MDLFKQEIENCIQNKLYFAFYYNYPSSSLKKVNNTTYVDDVENDVENEENKLTLKRFIPFSIHNLRDKFVIVEKLDEHSFQYYYSIYCEPFTSYSEDAWDKYSNCEGCRYGLSNQQGHMDYGGCLYLE